MEIIRTEYFDAVENPDTNSDRTIHSRAPLALNSFPRNSRADGMIILELHPINALLSAIEDLSTKSSTTNMSIRGTHPKSSHDMP
jgi:hypothetical protein